MREPTCALRSRCALLAVCLALPCSTALAGGGNLGAVKGSRPGPPQVGSHKQPSRSSQHQVAAPNAVRAETSGELVFSPPVNYQNLTLVAVSTTRQGPFQKYTLLESGLQAKTLQIRELRGHSGDAQVNAVEVRNTGNYPAYLLGGEMILGGKQDRIIEQDTVIPNDNKWTQVSVFCVEHGRWQGQRMEFEAGKALAHVGLQRAALSGDQSKVWAEVASKNTQQGTQSSTGTYRRTIQNGKVRAKIAPYRDQLSHLLPSEANAAGLIMAINGRIEVADLFGNPVLFADVRDKLLSSYILEALGQQVVRNAPQVSAAKAKMFIEKGRGAPSVFHKGTGRTMNYRKHGKGMVGTETLDKGTGQKIRESYLAE